MPMSDGASQSKKVLLGMTDGISSQVCAHLLKLQRYDIQAVTLIYDLAEKSSSLKKSTSCELSLDQQKKIVDFCHKLNIPHHFVTITREFYDSVVETWLSKKIEGEYYSPCFDCHRIRLSFLQEEARKLKFPKVATGHLAKVFEGTQGMAPFITVSNDLENDQSHLIAHSDFDLSQLILPLADLTKNDVLKLAKNFGIQELSRAQSECFRPNQDLIKFIESVTPKDFLKQGEILSFEGGMNFGIHEGVQKHFVGESMRFKEDRWQSDGYFFEYDGPSSAIKIAPLEELKYRGVLVRLNSEMTNLKYPKTFKASIKLRQSSFACWVQLKNFNYAHIFWDEDLKVFKGETVTLQTKVGKNAKVISTGVVTETYKKADYENSVDHLSF